MYYNNEIWVASAGDKKISIVPKMANRHGLIAGATGTGKTITLKVLAESFSDAGVPVFLADIKGDLSGMCRPGVDSEDMQKRIARFGLAECGFNYHAYPSTFWDIYGKMGIPVRTTISEMGPVLLSKLMGLNETQSDILTILFKIADDQDLLLIDTKDLKAMLQYASDNNAELGMEYGAMAKQSLTAILRDVVALEAAGSFATPEIMAISDETMAEFYVQCPQLERYRRYLEYLRRSKEKFDIIILDPPYAEVFLENALNCIAEIDILQTGGIIVTERPLGKDLSCEFEGLTRSKDYKYGNTLLTLYRKD